MLLPAAELTKVVEKKKQLQNVIDEIGSDILASAETGSIKMAIDLNNYDMFMSDVATTDNAYAICNVLTDAGYHASVTTDGTALLVMWN